MRNPHARTWQSYRSDLQQFAATLNADRPPNTVTLFDVDNFIVHQAGRGLQAASLNRQLAALVSLYAFLAEEDPTLTCPVLPRRHTLRQPHRLPRPVPAEAIAKFLAVIHSARDRAMFLLMLRCGLRIGEVAALQMSDVYLAEAHPRALVRGKGSKERAVYLSPHTEQAVRGYLAERSARLCPNVFLSYQGRALSTTAIHYRLIRYREQAGITLSAHRLRHTFASDLVAEAVPVTSIQKLLGHRWLETTQMYVAANDAQVQGDYFAAVQHWEGGLP